VIYLSLDAEELESSIDALLNSSCSQPDSGNFPAPVAIVSESFVVSWLVAKSEFACMFGFDYCQFKLLTLNTGLK
jgi:hypothetical protein